MQNYTKLYTKVLEDTNDLVDTAIIGVILEKVKGNNKPQLQQTYIAERLKLDKNTIYKRIKDLKANGYFNTKSSYYVGKSGFKQSTTEFEILPKLRNLIPTEKHEPKTQKPRHQAPSTQQPTNKHVCAVKKANKTEDKTQNEVWRTLTEPIKQITALNPTIQ